MQSLLVAALLAAPALVNAQSDTTRLRWVPNPRVASGGWVADPASHLRAESRERIDSIVAALERETSAEIAVVVLDSLDGLEPADAALLLHRRWGVGKRERDNGIVLLWSPALRQIYVAVGYGLEGVLPDSRAGRIQDREIVPAFRRGDFDGGMLAGVSAFAAAAREETYSGLPRARSSSTVRSRLYTAIAWILGVLGVIASGILLIVARLPRRCPNSHGFMRRLGERADNARLDRASQLEEQIGSVDYDVWVCDRCDATRVIPHRKLFSGYLSCPQCHRRTAKRQSVQLKAPTYTATGTREVRTACKHCGYRHEKTETIPVRVQSRSDSGGWSGGSGGDGGGGGSFGGGSSGGGGAGRSY